MTQALLLRQPLVSVFLTNKNNTVLRNILMLFAGTMFLAVSARLSINLLPVPITLQSFAVLFISMTCGWRIGVAVVTCYLFEGALGLPVFAPGPLGLAALLGPTGGYLFGFFPAALASGFLVERGWGKHHFTSFFAAFIGTVIIYAYGIFWLSKSTGIEQSIIIGCKPFLLGDTLKVMVLTVLIPFFWRSKRQISAF